MPLVFKSCRNWKYLIADVLCAKINEQWIPIVSEKQKPEVSEVHAIIHDYGSRPAVSWVGTGGSRVGV